MPDGGGESDVEHAEIDGSVQPEFNFKGYLGEVISTPKYQPSTALFSKAGTKRRALYGRLGSEKITDKKNVYDIDHVNGTAHATDIIRPNYYSPL
uniref:Uncharacterized protein n=1 Tax=Peronospora matthiolae TaxID=2874970 RepID=A0AAV1T711_9STRA